MCVVNCRQRKVSLKSRISTVHKGNVKVAVPALLTQAPRPVHVPVTYKTDAQGLLLVCLEGFCCKETDKRQKELDLRFQSHRIHPLHSMRTELMRECWKIKSSYTGATFLGSGINQLE